MEKRVFEQRLRYFLWEGRDNYFIRKQMRLAALGTAPGANGAEMELPEWPRLVELMRSFLDAPEALPPLAYLAKEIAFRTVAPAPKPAAETQLRRAFEINKRARQFIFLTGNYLVTATKLPREFASNLEAEVNDLLA